MGGCDGESNDDLVDNLLEANVIKSSLVERVVRAVDRAFYFTNPDKHRAYKDAAWKDGNLHLSSPTIYSTVLEGLDLRTGMYFLNIGSGTGYLSTMCGLMLGKNGVNHGIEVHPEVVIYARKKLEQFLKTSLATDEFDFCPPEFSIGNYLDTSPTPKRYDRIYCGATCQDQYVEQLVDMLKIGGACVVPVGDSLLKITRLEDNRERRHTLLPVIFAPLVAPSGSRAELPPITSKGLAVRTLSQLMSMPSSTIMNHLSCATNLDKRDLIHATILEYINNSQEPSHNFGIRVKSVIKINRKYNDGFNNLLFLEKMRMMLWHGTTFKNLSSIIQNGLTLPPPYQGGLLQGRAVYFADRASKSAQYCDERRKPSPGKEGVLLLCDVIMGRTHIPDNPDHRLTRPPVGFDSVTCQGRRAPSPSQYKHVDGVIYPSGVSCDRPAHSNCLVEFNEYAIYDPDLIDIKYIVQFTFTNGKVSNN